MPAKQELRLLWDDVISKIYIDNDGTVHYEPSLERRWEKDGGDFNLLLDIIGDNTYEEEDGDEVREEIDWSAVEKEYAEQHAS